jgi:AraC-like DNA-binding protein
MKEPIWVSSIDKSLLDWVKRNCGEDIVIVNPIHLGVTFVSRPKLMILACDYQCQREICFGQFYVANQYRELPTYFARPIYNKELCDHPYDYVISSVKQENSASPGAYFDERLLPHYSDNLGHNLRPSTHIAVRLQHELIASRGKLHRVSQLAKNANRSVSWLSTKFKQDVGLGLKEYANKIRLCNCLWELVSGYKSVKCIALEYGYKPTSFSLRFHAVFGTWPSKVRLG